MHFDYEIIESEEDLLYFVKSTGYLFACVRRRSEYSDSSIPATYGAHLIIPDNNATFFFKTKEAAKTYLEKQIARGPEFKSQPAFDYLFE